MMSNLHFEQPVLLAQYVDNSMCIVKTGRVLSGYIENPDPPKNIFQAVGPPVVTDDVDFYFCALQAN